MTGDIGSPGVYTAILWLANTKFGCAGTFGMWHAAQAFPAMATL